MLNHPAATQTPAPGELTVDHVAHFVPDLDLAGRELEQLGFTVTPFSAQSHRKEADLPLEPAGAGNRCVMLEQGYLEFLTPLGITEIASQLQTAMRRYVGVHLIAFGSARPEADHARVLRAGFSPTESVALQREVQTMTGKETACFTVVRVKPDTMPEGRIQFCRHLTPQWLWQERWTTHPNQAVGLRGVVFCVENPRRVASRYARFTGLSSKSNYNMNFIETARGYLIFTDARTLRLHLNVVSPSLPWIGGYVLESKNLGATASCLSGMSAPAEALDHERLLVALPPALGGFIIFEASDAKMIDFK